ncbi:hypothetical protein Scep_012197 [Stephania cephalantha]|uniref:Uncharacterized protein n=1 Tax=Stephania cephalantha TaxID=152367 RepID=A0AAP0P790_9MAGN
MVFSIFAGIFTNKLGALIKWWGALSGPQAKSQWGKGSNVFIAFTVHGFLLVSSSSPFLLMYVLTVVLFSLRSPLSLSLN